MDGIIITQNGNAAFCIQLGDAGYAIQLHEIPNKLYQIDVTCKSTDD